MSYWSELKPTILKSRFVKSFTLNQEVGLVHVYTTKDWLEEINDYKWHISCEGFCSIKNNIAYVTTVKEESVLTRHILKTISYRILGTITTVAVAYSLGASIELSSLLGIGELLLKPIIYFIHERLWYRHIRVRVRDKYGD